MASSEGTSVAANKGFDDEVFSAAYDELRRLAHGLKRGPANLTLNPTALVHEAYIKLASAGKFHADSPQHLKHTVVRAMKYLLVDAARRQAAASRGGADVALWRVPFDEGQVAGATLDPADILAVSDALDDLTAQNALAARAFELQFFGGLQIAEMAELLEVSEKKVQRLLRLAKSSLAVSLLPGRPPPNQD